MKKRASMVLVAGLAIAGTVVADNINGINMDFVNIGNAGNAADSTGYGAVGYDYRIGKLEVTADQFAASGVGSGNETEWGGGSMPVAKVSWHEAARYANWLTSGDANSGAYMIGAGNKVTAIDRAAAVATYGTVYVLPTEDEWYKAAYFTGSGYSLYANGTATVPVAEVDAVYDRDKTTGPWTADSGTVEQNGTFNMMGNVWEQLESAFDGNLDSIGEDMAYRGGGFWLGASKLPSTNRESDSPDTEYGNVGLRIVAIPEPGTISLMGLSTMGLFFTRTVRRRKQAGKSLLPIRREYSCDILDGAEPAVCEEESDALFELRQDAKAWLLSVWERVHARYAEIDRMFWNRMVVVHDRKVARRTRWKDAFKKRVLDTFDTFLARIMR